MYCVADASARPIYIYVCVLCVRVVCVDPSATASASAGASASARAEPGRSNYLDPIVWTWLPARTVPTWGPDPMQVPCQYGQKRIFANVTFGVDMYHVGTDNKAMLLTTTEGERCIAQSGMYGYVNGTRQRMSGGHSTAKQGRRCQATLRTVQMTTTRTLKLAICPNSTKRGLIKWA